MAIAFAPMTLPRVPAIAHSSSLLMAEETSGGDDDDDEEEIVARRIVVTGDVQGGYYRSCVLNEVCDKRVVLVAS